MAIYEDLKGTLLDRRYRVRRELGKGCFGTVFQATHEILAGSSGQGIPFREVALKVFEREFVTSDNARDAFREAILVEQVAAEAREEGEQPHVVAIYDVGVFQDYLQLPFIAMELVEGGSLERHLRLSVPVKKAVKLLREVCAGVRFAHSRNIYHLDLKPANILFSKSGFLKVSDFGRALERHEAFRISGKRGSIAYSAPELPGSSLSNGAEDVYSLGIILIEFLLNRNPFEACLLRAERAGTDHRGPLLEAQGELAELRDPDAGSSLVNSLTELRTDEGLQRILLNSLALESGQRYRNAGELDEALQDWEQGRMPRGPAAPAVSCQALLEKLSQACLSKQLDQAARCLDQIEKRCPSGRISFARSLLLEAKGDLRGAAKHLLESMRSDGFTTEGLLHLANLFRGLGETVIARTYRRQAEQMREKSCR